MISHELSIAVPAASAASCERSEPRAQRVTSAASHKRNEPGAQRATSAASKGRGEQGARLRVLSSLRSGPPFRLPKRPLSEGGCVC